MVDGAQGLLGFASDDRFAEERVYGVSGNGR